MEGTESSFEYLEEAMKQKAFIFTFIILHFTFFTGLSAQDTWIQTYQPFGDVDSYGVYYLNVCQDSGYAVNGYYHIYDPEFGIDEDWAYLMKVDSVGNFEWAYEETELWFNDHRSPCFVETDDGGFLMVITSMWGGTALVKLDSEGNRLWDADGQGLYPHSMDKTNDGNIILAGRMNGLPAIRKITQEADILWTNTYNISGDDDGVLRSVYVTANDDIVACGNVYFEEYNSDALVIRTDANGDSLWTRTFDNYNDNGNDIVILNNENIFCVGNSGIIWSGPLLWMLDTTGETIWIEYETAHAGYEQFFCFSTPDNNIIVSASILGFYKIDYNNNLIWLNDEQLPPIGNIIFYDNNYMVYPSVYHENNQHHIAVLKTDSTGSVVSVDEEITILKPLYLHCYPNPFNPITTISFDVLENAVINLRIYNIKGQLVKKLIDNEYTLLGSYQVIWDGSEISDNTVSSGIYYICLRNDSSYVTQKVLLIK